MTNPEIATELFLSPKTVSAHVEHILAKLGANRRAEIASWVSSIAPTGRVGVPARPAARTKERRTEEAGPVAGTGLELAAAESAAVVALPRQVMLGFQSSNSPRGLPCQIQACRS